MTSRPRRRRVEPTDELRWEQIELLCGWPEQRDYELIRPLVLFGSSSDERSRETGASSGRTLRRRAARFEAEGMESLFGSEAAKRRRLPPGVRRLIVDLKAEYPSFNPNEISRVCYVRFGRRPARKTVKRVLAEEPIPLRFVRRFPPYHEIPERSDGRAAVVALHADGWSVKAISGYLRVGTSTVYRVLKRWAEEGPEGLEDRPHGRPPGVRKVTLKAMEAIRRFQQNPHLGEFRIHAALAQIGIHLSPRTRGRILALNRELYGLEKPRGPVKEKREMPFAARRRHQFWSADVRYIDDHELGDRAYVISILDNHSRAVAQNITGTNGPDELRGTSQADKINGRGGADELRGLNGADELFGSDGKDQLFGGPGADTLKGGSGDDLLGGAEGGDTLRGGIGNDELEGRGGDDTIVAAGDGERDEVKCGDGTDVAEVDLNDVVDDQLVSSVVALPGGVVSILSCETVRVGLLE
jgi:transposase